MDNFFLFIIFYCFLYSFIIFKYILDKFLYIIYDYHSPEKLAIDEIIKALGDSESYIGYKNKIILKGENILPNVLPSQAFKDACKVCKKLFEMGY